MKTAIIFDCEFLTAAGAMDRYWSGPGDPDPVIAQIGAAKLGLKSPFPILDTYRSYVQPVDRFGNNHAIDPFFTELTGITSERIAAEGVPLEEALAGFDRYSEGMRCWSWGKDELNMVAISCYIAGLAPPIAARRFANACKLFQAAGMPIADFAKLRSGALADYYGVAPSSLKAHDAADDALSIAYALQHLLRTGRLAAQAFDEV